MSADQPETAGIDTADHAAEFDIVSRDAVPAAGPRGGVYRDRDEDIARLRLWLQPTDYLSPGSEYMKHLHAHVPGTGSWMHQSADFKTWLHDSTSTPCMHLKGVAGSGKSVLAANTIRFLQQLQPDAPVLFFFFRQIVEKNHSASYLIRDFAAQLLPYSPSLVQALDSISKSTGVNGTEKNALWKAIARTLQDIPRTFCVIDALDEMDEDDFNFMTNLVDEVTRDAGGVRLLLTSRPLPHIEDALKGPKILRDRLDASLLYPDVATFVTVSMSTLEPSLSPETEDQVRDTICQRAQGLFLHARLMTEHLTEGLRDGLIKEEDLPDKLDSLPANLIEAYEQMLAEHARRSGVRTEQQAGILSCVIHASRPLRLIELGALIARMRGDDNLKEGKRLIRASCGRLLEILEDESVSVIHHSFTEFLQNKERKATLGSFPTLDTATGHRMLVLLSLQYLSGSPEVPTDLVDPCLGVPWGSHYREWNKRDDRRKRITADLYLEYPLLQYTTQNLKHHLSHVGEDDSEVFEALDNLLSPDSPAFRMCLFTWQNRRLCRDSTSLHLAVLEDMVSYAKYLIATKPACIDAKDRFESTPLSYAAAEGHTDIATLLLRNGADPKSADDIGLSPLHLAARGGHAEVARLLLAHGVSPTIEKTKDTPGDDEFWTPDKGRTALQDAMRSRKIDLVCLFLPFLSAEQATEYFHEAVGAEVRDAILSTGHAVVDSYCGGRTALFEAAQRRDVKTMRVLLKHGANPNTRCSKDRSYSRGPITLKASHPRGPMPVHAFAGVSLYECRNMYDEDCEQEARECLKLLVEHGADIHATTAMQRTKGMTALHFAVQKKEDLMCGYDSKTRAELCLTKLLLEAGVDPNAKTGDGRTALYFVDPNAPLVVDLLVDHGADVNVMDDMGKTPLISLVSMATTRQSISSKLVEKLIEYGAATDVVDKKGNTIFHYMFRAFANFRDSDKPLFESLIKDRHGLNTPNKEGNPPLFLMPLKGLASRRELLQFLVDKGLDLKARNVRGHTRLWQHITGFGDHDLESFQILQDLGADTKALDQNGESLLHAVVRKALPVSWLKHLISSGIDPKLKTKNGLSLIHVLLEQAEPNGVAFDTIDILEEMGVVAAETAPKGRTPLHIASLRQDNDHDPARGLEKTFWIEAVLGTSIFGQPDVNARDFEGLTPLHLAASVSEYNVGRLLKGGANPTTLTNDGVAALHIACCTRRPNVTSVLLACYQQLGVLQQYIDMKITIAQESFTALHLACSSGCVESVSLLLQHGANPSTVDGHGRTPLHVLAAFWPQCSSDRTPLGLTPSTAMTNMLDDVAAKASNECKPEDLMEIVDLLCSAGASLEAHTPDGLTPEGIARAASHGDFLRILSQRQGMRSIMEHSTDSTRSEVVQTLLKIEDKTTLPQKLFEALKNHGPEVIWEFATLGGDVYALDEYGDSTFFHKLAKEGHAHQLTYFKAKLAQVDDMVDAQLEERKLEAHRAKNIASDPGDQDDCTDDTSSDLDINAHDAGGPGTLLATACRRRVPSLDVVKLLVEEVGLDINAAAHVRGFAYKLKKATPLHILACGQHHWQIEALRYLLSKGADIEACNSQNMSSLLIAISSDWPSGFWKEDTVRCLLEHGADTRSLLSDSHTAAIWSLGHAGVARALFEHGVDISCVPGAIGSAVDAGDIDLVRVLLENGANVNSIQHVTGGKNNLCWNCERSAESGSGAESEVPPEYRYLIHVAATRRPQRDPTLKLWGQKRDAIIAALLAHGADTSLAYGDDRIDVLQRIVEDHGRVGLVLKDITREETQRRRGGGRTLLMSSCMASVPPHRDCRDDPKELTVHLEAAHIVLDAGASTDSVDDEGRTALHWLCTMTRSFDGAHKELFETLITRSPSVLEMADRNGDTPLSLCLRNRQFWAAERLMEHAALVHGTTSGGNTLLHLLARELVGEETKALAAGELFKKILSTGVDVNARNEKGESSLFVCMAAPWVAVPDHAHGTLLHSQDHDHALAHDIFHRDALSLFLEAGADIHTVDNGGSTLLHAVASQSMIYDSYHSPQSKDLSDVFARLLELGLDPRQEDNKMRTALDLATARGWDGIMDLFSDQGRERLRKKWKKWEEKR